MAQQSTQVYERQSLHLTKSILIFIERAPAAFNVKLINVIRFKVKDT